MNIYSLILDILTAIIGLGIIVSAYRKGFLRSIILVIGYIASIFVAIYLSKYISSFIYTNFIRENIINSVQNLALTNPQNADVANIVNDFLQSLPKLFSSSIIAYFGGNEAIINNITNSTTDAVKDMGILVADTIAAPIITGLLQTICCFIVFLICIFIVKIISRAFSGFYAVPILGTINSVLGGVVGIAQAAIWIYILGILGKMVISFTANSLTYFNMDIINNSYLYNFFYHLKFI